MNEHIHAIVLPNIPAQAISALVLYDNIDQTNEVTEIMGRVVSATSIIKYNNENKTFIFWIHRSDVMIRELLLEEWMIVKLDTAKALDIERGKALMPEMRKVCKEVLGAVQKGENNCPIILQSLTFNIYSHYLTTRRKKGTLVYLSKTSYNGIKSALCHLFRMSGSEMSFEMKKDLGQFMSGMKITVATSRQATGHKLDGGGASNVV